METDGDHKSSREAITLSIWKSKVALPGSQALSRRAQYVGFGLKVRQKPVIRSILNRSWEYVEISLESCFPSLQDKHDLPDDDVDLAAFRRKHNMKQTATVSSCLAVLLMSALLSPPASAGGTANLPAQRRLVELVRRLGAEDYQVRERASRELFQIGLAAKEALLEGARDPDLEVRRRCRDLLPEILEADRQARLAAFIADKDGKETHDLPGWSRYRAIAGEDAAARKLFIDIQKADTGFLADVDRDPQHAGQQCGELAQALFQKQFGRGGGRMDAAKLSEIVPLLLVAADPKVEIPAQQRYLVFNLLYQPAAQSSLRSRDSSPFKRVVLAWMERQADDESALSQVFYLVNNLEIREGLDLALRAIRDKKLKGVSLATAMTTVGKFGDKGHLSVLEAYLDDKTEIGNFNLGNLPGRGAIQGKTQVRDAALAMLVRLTKQSHKDYGFAVSRTNNEHLLMYANFLGFNSDDERGRAFKKWNDWKADHKK